MTVDATRALRTAAAAGEFFTLAWLPAGGGWFRLRELTCDPGALDRRIARVRETSGRPGTVAPDDVPVRAAASVDLLGLGARVLSPALAACGLAGVAPHLTLDRLWWQHGPQRLAVTQPSGRAVTTPEDAAAALDTDLISTVLLPLVAAFAARYRLSTKVLWGNVASALNGSAEVLAASGLQQRLPVREIVTALLRTPNLRSTVRTTAPRFVRNSCCLYYRIPGGSMCGDCLLSA